LGCLEGKVLTNVKIKKMVSKHRHMLMFSTRNFKNHLNSSFEQVLQKNIS